MSVDPSQGDMLSDFARLAGFRVSALFYAVGGGLAGALLETGSIGRRLSLGIAGVLMALYLTPYIAPLVHSIVVARFGLSPAGVEGATGLLIGMSGIRAVNTAWEWIRARLGLPAAK